jgi:sugar phosphate isomerase/epimerase
MKLSISNLAWESEEEAEVLELLQREPGQVVQGAALVRAVDSAGFGLHLDATGMFMAGENPAILAEHLDILRHFHISEPQLGGFATPQTPHAEFAAILKQISYRGWVSIEMRRQDKALAKVERALAGSYTAHRHNLNFQLRLQPLTWLIWLKK